MSTSTDGIICFGVQFEEGHEFPWGESDSEDWWREVNGYVPPFELWWKGEYARGRSEKDKEAWYSARDKWDKENPIPFELVNYCSGDCKMYIIAVKGSVVTADRGYPTVIDLSKMTGFKVPAAFTKFMKEYFPGTDSVWLLCSY